MNRLCDTCRKELQPGHAFCDQCGAPVLPVVSAAATMTDPSPEVRASAATVPPIVPPPAPSRSGALSVVIALFAVLALAGAAAGGWMYLHHGPVAVRAPGAASGSTVTATTATVVKATTSVETDAAANAALASTRTALDDPAAVATAPLLDAASEAASHTRACSLLTRAELEPIIGAKIVKITSTDQACSYSTDETRSVDIETTWTGGKASYTEMQGFNSQVSTVVPGLGDDAYFQAAGVLHLLKGDRYVVVNSRAYPDELKTESAIAAKILEKLK